MNEPTDTDRLNWLQYMAPECEGHILSRVFLPTGEPLRNRIDEAMKINPLPEARP